MSEQKQRLVKFENIWEADALKNLLVEKGIAYYEIKQARDYSSIITGIGQGYFEIYVDASQFSEAQEILHQYKKATSLHLVSEPAQQAPVKPHYLRRIIFLSLASLVFLPIIFNFVAYLNFRKMQKLENSNLNQQRWALVILVLGFVLASLELLWFFGLIKLS